MLSRLFSLKLSNISLYELRIEGSGSDAFITCSDSNLRKSPQG